MAGALIALLLPALIRPAAAAPPECRPQRLATLPIVLLHDTPLVTVTIDGHAASFILDTGAEQTILSADAAKRLGLALHYEYPHRLRGLGGGLSDGQVDLHSLSFAGLKLQPYPIRVGGIVLPALEGGAPAGLLGADILSDFDLDIDLPGRRLTLYRRQNCADAKPAWPPPFAEIAANRSLHDHLFFDVALDGRRLAAFIDTGAQISVLDRTAAAALGVDAAVLAGDPAALSRGVAAHVVPSRIHRFRQLRIGADTAIDSPFAIVPLHLNDADLILGVTWLRNRRVWLSYGAPAVFLKRPP